MSEKSKCEVNTDGSVRLSDILVSFDNSIREEHAWALCYQCAKYFREVLRTGKPNCHVITEMGHVYLRTDGQVHERTVTAEQCDNRIARTEKDLVAGLGFMIYATLDKRTQNGEERPISEDLEEVINDMISMEFSTDMGHQETDDEGIEKDADDCEEPSSSRPNYISLEDVIKRCEKHLEILTKIEAEAHYKAVVRALVAEALELSTFLDNVAQGILPSTSSNSSSLNELQFSDWARFWVQVMRELRTGVKLKKVNYSKAPIEYELTPYEVLMKDIRNCKYNLRKIMINGDVPSRVTKDAHAIILNFIRSRPPLKKVSDRKIAPKSSPILTPREQLLNSIRRGRKLRPVPAPRATYAVNRLKIQSPREAPPVGRKLIKVDFSQFEDEEEDDDVSTPDSTMEPGLWSSEFPQTVDDSTLEAYDLAMDDYVPGSRIRRHTLGLVDNNCYSVPQSRPCSRQSCNSSEAESMHMEPEVARAIQRELTNTQTWQETISLDDRLSLTLSEIVHIRTVLTKAELEALPVEGRVRHDAETRRVCFLCLKTRFGIFGPWGQRCTLCKRTVCSRCYSRMNIPMEHFSSVPVVLLSPSIMCTPDDEHKVFGKTLLVNHKTDEMSRSYTRESSPEPSRPSSSMDSSTISDPGTPLGTKFRTRALQIGRTSRMVDRLKASQMVVCHDCKMMVLQIIKSARINRSAIRNKTLQSLTLNLSPVF